MTLDVQPREEPIALATGSVSTIALSPRGDRLVLTRDTSNVNIWAVELFRSALEKNTTAAPKPWITSSANTSTPAFSPDGQQIAIQTDRSGWTEIWITDRDGSHPRQLTDLKGIIAGFPHWSPDGKKIAFHLRQQSEASLVVVDVLGGSVKRLNYEAANDFAPTWSHDGKWIYFSSRRSGDTQIWKIPAEGGPAIQITKNGGMVPSESADGKNLFYIKAYGSGSIWSMSLPRGPERHLLSNVAGYSSAFAVGRNGLYFVGKLPGAAGEQLAFLNFATGKIRTLADIVRPVGLGIAVSPDEKLVLYAQNDQAGSDLMLVENFR